MAIDKVPSCDDYIRRTGHNTRNGIVVKKKIVRTANKIAGRYVSFADMPKQVADPSALAEFVRRVMREHELDAPTVERRAKRNGFDIDRTYVNKILSGAVGHLTVPKLQALAAGLNCNEDDLFAVARGLREPEGFRETRFWELFEQCQEIENKAHRQLVEEILDGVIGFVRALAKRKADDSYSAVEAVRKSK